MRIGASPGSGRLRVCATACCVFRARWSHEWSEVQRVAAASLSMSATHLLLFVIADRETSLLIALRKHDNCELMCRSWELRPSKGVVHI
jgi:hypothetical protein